MNDAGTVRVCGTGMIRLRPDTVQITMTLEGTDPAYSAALKRSAADTDRIREALGSVGFTPDALKTASFGVQAEYEGYQEEGVYRQRLIGYRFRHELRIEFPADNERLGEVLAAIADVSLTPEIRIGYTVRDREAAKNALLGLAVRDARAKAEALTAAAGVRLGCIRHINYSVNDGDFSVQPILYAGMARKATADSFAPEIVPEDIEARDSVSIVWEIE